MAIDDTDRVGMITNAATLGDVDRLRLLLDRKAAVNPRTGDGRTPLDMAQGQNHAEVAALLRQHGAE